MAESPLCSIPDCGKPSDRLGFCTAHYMRNRRNGNPIAGRTPPGSIEAFINAVAVSSTDECIIWPFFMNKTTGYGEVKIDRKSTTAHRAVLCAATGESPSRHIHAAHAPEICHNKLCVNPRHLRWATRRENEADKIIDGTRLEGTSSPRAVFTEHQVRLIRSDKRSDAKISKELGVSEYAVWCARLRKTYKNIS